MCPHPDFSKPFVAGCIARSGQEGPRRPGGHHEANAVPRRSRGHHEADRVPGRPGGHHETNAVARRSGAHHEAQFLAGFLALDEIVVIELLELILDVPVSFGSNW